MNGEPAASVGRDLVGGFNAAMIGLPYTLGRGIVAFALLGPSFAAEGALAGILGAVGVGLLVPLFGGTRVMISGPRVTMALVVAATLAEIAAPGSPFAGRTAVVAAFAMLALAGLIQVLLGAFRIGGLIRYVPYPVITGIVTGSGILIVLDQMRARLLAGLAVDPMHRAQISRFQHHPNHTGHDTAHGDAAESGNDIAGDGHERPLKRKLKPFLSTRTNLLCWKNISQNKPRSVSCLRR